MQNVPVGALQDQITFVMALIGYADKPVSGGLLKLKMF